MIRKDYIEYVYKLQGGWYGVVNMFVSGPNEVILFLDWAHYFKRITNHTNINKLLLSLENPCPAVFRLFTQGSKYTMITLPYFDQMGIARRVSLNTDCCLMELLGNPTVVKEAKDLLSYGLDVYHEINRSCPYPDWKKGLVEEL